MSQLEFDEETHTYRFAGRVIPSVSQIIRELSFADLWHVPPQVLRDAAEFGTRVHKLTEHYDHHGWLPEFYDLPKREASSLEAWMAFRVETNFTPYFIERRVHHPVLGYAGTIDRIGRISDNNTGTRRRVVLDIKTSDPHDWHGVQLAGYLSAARHAEIADMMTERLAVYLGDDGSYRMRLYESPSDWSTFIHHIKQQKEQQ